MGTQQPGDIYPSADSGFIEAVGAVSDVSRTLLNSAMANSTAWRVLEVWSDEGLPFEVLLLWTGANAGGQRARFTVGGGSARFCFAGRGITGVNVTNRASVRQFVKAAVASTPGPITTYNHFQQSVIYQGGQLTIQPPPYSDRVKILATSAADAAATTVSLLDGALNVVGSYLLSAQPSNGEAVSGIRELSIVGVVGARYSVDFALGA